jgi:hypothetical protein
MEHSGTAVFEFLLFSHILIHSGFGTRILAGTLEEFEKTQPFSVWLGSSGAHWGLPQGYLDRIQSFARLQRSVSADYSREGELLV